MQLDANDDGEPFFKPPVLAPAAATGERSPELRQDDQRDQGERERERGQGLGELQQQQGGINEESVAAAAAAATLTLEQEE